MSRRCDLTGKTAKKAANRSHSKIKTLRRQFSNVQKKKLFIPELNRSVTIMLSSKGIRNITKHGSFATAILKAKLEDLTPALRKVRRELLAR